MKKQIRFRTKYVLILLILCGCTNSTTPVTSPSLQQVKTPLANNPNPGGSDQSISPKQESPDSEKTSQDKKVSNTSGESPETHPDTFRSGSNIPSIWIYSKDGMVGCRINKWFGYGGTEQGVDFEFVNIKSKNPVNIVYRVNSIGVKGKVYRLLNFGSDNQVEYTKFIPSLKKGERKIDKIGLKYPSYHSTQAINLLKIEIKDCRIKRDGENELTLKPEHVKYINDNPRP
jgi:hypothetical protein